MVVDMDTHERLIRDLLQAITDNEPAEVISGYWHPDAEQVELPSLMRPTGHTRKLAEMLEGYRAGADLLLWQEYAVENVVDDGQQLAVQLRCTATTAVDAGDLPAGTELVAHVAVFYRFRDGKILRQSSYDCYEPIKTAA
jgi:ketosteroid isomerase-like protein